MKIGIVNNSIGNVASVLSALKFYNFDVKLLNKPGELDNIDIIILSGVGNFNAAAAKLKQMHFWDKIDEQVKKKKKPLIGLCLGMQLFADVGFENGKNLGFGWIKGKVVRINDQLSRVPHIGWDEVKTSDPQIFKNIRYSSFYFMHSYHFVPQDKRVIIGTTNLGQETIAVAVRKNNLVGVQFHPEKSQGDGLRLLKNMVEVFS